MDISEILKLCDFRSYSYPKDSNDAIKEIQDKMGPYEVLWGPAWKSLSSLVCVLATPLGTTVVIRGTHTKSITNIVFDDMRLALVPMEGIDGKILKGLRSAVQRTLALRPRPGFPGHGQSLMDFIREQRHVIHFVGYSLGGSISTVLAALFSSPATVFASFSPGDSAFNRCLNERSGLDFLRISNTNDIVNFLYDDTENVSSIYEEYTPGPLMRAIIGLCNRSVRGKDYMHSTPVLYIENKLMEHKTYLQEAYYQHYYGYNVYYGLERYSMKSPL